MADKCIVRNVAYPREKVGNMERHNERKNERYGNGDVQLDRIWRLFLFPEIPQKMKGSEKDFRQR